jgi:hypothetical protein
MSAKVCVIEGFRLNTWPIESQRNQIAYSVILDELNEDAEIVYFHASQSITSPTPLVMEPDLATGIQAQIEADAQSRGWLT